MENKEVLLAANAVVMKGDNEGFLTFCTDTVSSYITKACLLSVEFIILPLRSANFRSM